MIGDCFKPHQVVCEGFLSHSHGRSQLTTLVDCLCLEDPHLVSGCVAPAKGLALDCQLAHDPSSRCIATTRTSLPRSK
jgi:hypothetical protein